MAEKVALITGVTGQDGAYLAQFLSSNLIDRTAFILTNAFIYLHQQSLEFSAYKTNVCIPG